MRNTFSFFIQIGFCFLFLVTCIPNLAFAAWDGTPYDPGETLDPECAPTTTDCRVFSAVYIASSTPAGSIPYTTATDTWAALPIGANGKVLKVVAGNLTWDDDQGGVAYSASEQGLHLDSLSHIFSLVLDGNSLALSPSGLKISNTYAGQNSITSVGTIATGTWQGTPISPLYGGTGTSTVASSGQLLIGNGTGYSGATPTGSNGILVTSGAGSLDIGLSINGLSSVSSVDGGDYLPLYSTLGGVNRKISYNDLFGSFLGALNYRGTWDANTNTPTLNDAACMLSTKGYYYIVSAAGSTDLNGITTWNVNDWVICDGNVWGKIETTNTISSVFGRTGTITSQNGDYTASQITNVASGTIAAITVQGALNELALEKEGVVVAGTTGQYYRGDKTWQTLDTLAVTENPSNLYFTEGRARNALSVSGIGLTYSTTTGIFSLGAGYSIPLTASSTNWNTFFDVPSTRITAGTGLAWTGNTLGINGALPITSGGTGTTTLPSYGQLLMGNPSGGYTLVATSTLGFNATSSQWVESGNNLSFTLGNVGIGTSSSLAALTVGGNGTGSGVALQVLDGADAVKLSVLDNGKVSIGTTTSGALVTIGGNAYIGGSTGTTTIEHKLSTLTGLSVGLGVGDTFGLNIDVNGNINSSGIGGNSLAINSNVFDFLGVSGQQLSLDASGFSTFLPNSASLSLTTGLELNTASSKLLSFDDTGILNVNSGKLYVNATGSVGIGTTSPIAKLTIEAGTGAADILAIASSTSGRILTVTAGGALGVGIATPGYKLHVKGSDGAGNVAKFETSAGSLVCLLSGITGLINCTSDENLKKDINPIEHKLGLESLMKLNPVTYHWKTEESDAALKYGFIAQRVEEVYPELVSTDKETGYKTLSLNGFVPFIVKAIQDQQVLLGDIADQDGLTSLVDEIQAESSRNAGEYIQEKIADGFRPLTNFIAGRVTAVRGYFNEVHTQEVCLGTYDGNEICLTGDMLKDLIEAQHAPSYNNQDTPPVVTPAPVTPVVPTPPNPEEVVVPVPPAENPIVPESPLELPPSEEPTVPEEPVNTNTN